MDPAIQGNPSQRAPAAVSDPVDDPLHGVDDHQKRRRRKGIHQVDASLQQCTVFGRGGRHLDAGPTDELSVFAVELPQDVNPPARTSGRHRDVLGSDRLAAPNEAFKVQVRP